MTRRELNLRIIGAVYFPVQFLLVWLLYFGFTAYPSLSRLWHAFGIGDIVTSALQFAAILPIKFFTAERLIHFLLRMIPYALRVILSGWRIYLFAFAAWQLIQWIVGTISYACHKSETVSDSASVIVKIGAPGSGKSSSAGAEAICKAAMMWRQLKYDYWYYSGRLEYWRETDDVAKLQEWYEIRDAYEFYSSRPDCIPCLWANIPIRDLHGRMANELTVDALYQRVRLPAFSVLYIDEIGSMVDVELYRDKPWDLDNFFRFCRHFGRFLVIATEQSAENIYINCRRVVSYNQYMLRQRWVCKPYPLMALYALCKLVLPRIRRAARPLSAFMGTFNSVVRHIGYRKYTYSYEGNTERAEQLYRGGKRCYYLPSALNYYYDDRTYRNYYLAKDMPLEARIYGSMVLAQETDAGQRYLRMREALDREAQQRAADARALLQHVLQCDPGQTMALIKQFRELNKAQREVVDDPELEQALTALVGQPDHTAV